MSLAKIRQAPDKGVILLVGSPGAGKSAFCHQVVLNALALERPVIYVTTERRPAEVIDLLIEKGLGEPPPGALGFVDAFSQTVGVQTQARQDTLSASCMDLNSITIAVTRLQERAGQKGILLAFDSLTCPYLFGGTEVAKFARLFLSRFAAEGNSVVALMDEGCGKQEDLVAMMSVSDGIIRMEIREGLTIISVLKHPKLGPTQVEVPMTRAPETLLDRIDPKILGRLWESSFSARPGQAMRTEVGDFVNVFWKNLAFWSGMLWDPKRLPTIVYHFDKQVHAGLREAMSLAPWRMRLLMRLFIPKSFSEVRDAKRLSSRFLGRAPREGGMGIWEYVEEASRRNEHHFRLYESSDCWGFDNVGARLGFPGIGSMAGILKGLEKTERDWNIVETKCIGMGAPYCEFKLAPGQTGELKAFLEGIDNSVAEKVHSRLMDQLIGLLVHEEPLPVRPEMGSGIAFNRVMTVTTGPALISQRYRMALRMGGAKAGKEVGEHLMMAGLREDEVIKRVIGFMNACKVGKVTLGETVTMKENCEAFGLETGEPSCFFTTGFLNGFFSAIKNQHVREVKCIAADDPYCEWEII
jgi:predicted hydrocarbon binding protein/KaiC/GvpD/RAD55 family RecA-like ATPase